MSIIKVKTDCRTIQEAIRAASPGDTILVERGTYRESVTVNKNDICIVGEGLVIIDGEFSRPFGIVLDGVSGLRLQALQMINCNENGLLIKGGSENSVTDCRTDCCGKSGTKIVSSADSRLVCCYANGNGRCGIELVESCDTLIDHCLLKSNAYCGIEGIDSFGISEIIGCDIRHNITIGCNFEGEYPVRLINNFITDNLGDGCRLSNALSELSGNIVSGNRQAGIVLTGSGCVLQKNRFTEQGDTGLSINDGCSICNNHFIDNGTYGLLVRGTDNVIKSNCFSGNKEADVRRLHPKNTFIDNDFRTSIPYELNLWQVHPDNKTANPENKR